MLEEINKRSDLQDKVVWVLLDDKAGHNSQALGVADALSLPFIKKQISYSKLAKKPNILKFNPEKTIDSQKSDNIFTAGWPDIIISCGRKLAPISKEIKKRAKKSGKKVFICHLMWPDLTFIRNIDLIASPSHDNIPLIHKYSDKIIKTVGSPNRISKEFLLQDYRIWSRTIGEMPHPCLVVLVGGNTREAEFTIDNAKFLIEKIITYVSNNNASILISTSRRTSDKVADFLEVQLKNRIGKYLYFHNYNKSKANPFYAFLQMADKIIVSGDSISMCSEACSVGKPVYIYKPANLLPEKHLSFVNMLVNKEYANFLDEKTNNFTSENLGSKPHQKILNTSQIVAKEILKRV
jgi:hypothetical protein